MAGRKRTGTRAAVEIQENVPVGPEPSAEVFIAQHEGRMVRDEDRAQDEDGNHVTTTHTRPGTLVMYKPTEKQGYVPKVVSGSAVRLLLRQGWREFCPDCNGRHIDKNGVESSDPNLCSARDPVKVGVCRVCDKRVFDNQGFTEMPESDDPNVIDDEMYTRTTPEQRVRAALNLHYWLRHPRQAQMMNLPPLPTALRDLVEGSQTT